MTTLMQARESQIRQWAVGYTYRDAGGVELTRRTVVPAIDGQAALHWMRQHYRNLTKVWLIPAPKGAKQ